MTVKRVPLIIPFALSIIYNSTHVESFDFLLLFLVSVSTCLRERSVPINDICCNIDFGQQLLLVQQQEF